MMMPATMLRTRLYWRDVEAQSRNSVYPRTVYRDHDSLALESAEQEQL